MMKVCTHLFLPVQRSHLLARWKLRARANERVRQRKRRKKKDSRLIRYILCAALSVFVFVQYTAFLHFPCGNYARRVLLLMHSLSLYSFSSSLLSLFFALPASRIRCLTECCLPCQNCHALISSSGLFSSRNISITTLCCDKERE